MQLLSKNIALKIIFGGFQGILKLCFNKKWLETHFWEKHLPMG
jgi:hypothetical protein